MVAKLHRKILSRGVVFISVFANSAVNQSQVEFLVVIIHGTNALEVVEWKNRIVEFSQETQQ